MTDHAGTLVSSMSGVTVVIGGDVNLKAVLCQSCTSVGVSLLCSDHPNFDWAMKISCIICFQAWSICKQCPRFWTKLNKPYMLNKHHSQCHAHLVLGEELISDNAISPEPLTNQASQNLSESPPDFNSYSMEDIMKSPISCGSDKSNTFFQYDQSAAGGGSTYLIHRAVTESPNFISQLLHPDDVCYHMKVGKFVAQLTNGTIIKLKEKIAISVNETLSSSTHYLRPSLPSTTLFIDNVYIRGKNSLLENIPYPSVTVIDNHAYVSIIDCIAHLLSFSSIFTYVKKHPSHSVDVMHITDSRKVQQIKDQAASIYGDVNVVVLYLTEWSDDFDPSMSTKANRQSCWIKTVSVMSGNVEDNMNNISTTFPIAIGKIGNSHEMVEQQFADELRQLRSGTCAFFNKSTASAVPVYVELLASLQDQPEQQSVNCLMLGGGKYSARWGYSLNIAEVHNNTPACSQCLLQMKQNGPQFSFNYTCTQCTRWETCSDHPLLRTNPPSKYPSEVVGNGLISPIKLTYDILKEAIATTHDNIVSNAWSADQAKHYLWVFGVNNDAISSLIDHATNVKLFNAVERLKDRMPREYNIFA
jgi:hypothetical protein